MPYGAQRLEDGQIRFRLWAPAAKNILLCLERPGPELTLPMQPLPDGWFECVTNRTKPGSHYRFQLDTGMRVPDPASRFNPDDVHGASQVIDPAAYAWRDDGWRGRPWEEAVIYELHVGAFSPEGTYAGVKRRLDYLVELGITAIELMPLADFPGARNWGYDGALLYAPDHRYGTPDELKDLIQSAHDKGLMVLLDVVYNHFGPEGNYLHLYAPQFFTERHHTPWGAAINYDGEHSKYVRDFYIHNALYWLEEYRFDGLRLDAVHCILDDSRPDILDELAQAVRNGPGRERHIHLVLENDLNEARYLGRPHKFDAQWNDDIHHALHVLLTGEHDGYYEDYADKPLLHLMRCLTEGFAYQGEPSPHRHGVLRGSPCEHLSPEAFVSFLQNHDQIGNRAFGERLTQLVDTSALRAVAALVLLAPSPPLLFMGEEFGALTPFLFFCDFGPDLASAVREGRRREFARFVPFAGGKATALIPDPGEAATFESSRLDWNSLQQPEHQGWLQLYRQLLAIRRERLVPYLAEMAPAVSASLLGERALKVEWQLNNGSRLRLMANLGRAALLDVARPAGELLFASEADIEALLDTGMLPPWSVAWFLEKEAT